MSLASTGFELVTKRTCKREFLDEMNLVIPWSELLALIAPHTLEGKTGRPPFPTGVMLGIHLLQQFVGHSDPAMEEALHDILNRAGFMDRSSKVGLYDGLALKVDMEHVACQMFKLAKGPLKHVRFGNGFVCKPS